MNCSLVGRPASLNSRIPSERFRLTTLLGRDGAGVLVLVAFWVLTLGFALAAARIFRIAVLRVAPIVCRMRLISASSFGVQLFFFAIASLHAPGWCWGRTIPLLSEK